MSDLLIRLSKLNNVTSGMVWTVLNKERRETVEMPFKLFLISLMKLKIELRSHSKKSILILLLQKLVAQLVILKVNLF